MRRQPSTGADKDEGRSLPQVSGTATGSGSNLLVSLGAHSISDRSLPLPVLYLPFELRMCALFISKLHFTSEDL